jgi:hypothetical protein
MKISAIVARKIYETTGRNHIGNGIWIKTQNFALIVIKQKKESMKN